jgi:putative FmdB family regulatory protein
MPIFEYRCRACGHEFEALILPSTGAAVCPSCEGHDLEQLLSLFSVSSESTRQSSLKQARQKNSAIQREKTIADQELVRKHHDH